MSEIPPDIETLVANHFTVIDVVYYPNAVEFEIEKVDPVNSREKFLELVKGLSPHGLLPKLTLDGNSLKLHVFKTSVPSRKGLKGRIILLVATIITVILSGWVISHGTLELLREAGISELYDPIVSTVAHTLGLMIPLALHELGHAIYMMKWGAGELELPVFIPAPPPPFGFGTFGALIVQRKPSFNRDELFELGISGPIFGLIPGIAVSILGILQSHYIPTSIARTWIEQGKAGFLPTPLVFALLEKIMSRGEGVLLLSPLALAGLIILLITFLNALPISQLDGGHIAYALTGSNRKLKRMGWIASIGLLLIAPVLGVLMLILNAITLHPPPLDEYSLPSEKKRKWGVLAYLSILLLTFPVLQ